MKNKVQQDIRFKGDRAVRVNELISEIVKITDKKRTVILEEALNRHLKGLKRRGKYVSIRKA